MNLAKVIFWVFALYHLGAMAEIPQTAPKHSENDGFAVALAHSDPHLPTAITTDCNRIPLLEFWSELEPKSNNASHYEKISVEKVQDGLIMTQLNLSRNIVPSLDTLTIIYPFHAFP